MKNFFLQVERVITFPVEDGLIYNGIGKPVITDKGFKFFLDRLVLDWKSNFIPKFKEI